jgi:hypothetical protein
VPPAALDEMRLKLESISDEIGSLLAAAHGPLRPAQADRLARVRKQTREVQALLDQLAGGEAARPVRLAGDPHTEVRS